MLLLIVRNYELRRLECPPMA